MIYLPQISEQTRYFTLTFPVHWEFPEGEQNFVQLELYHNATGQSFSWLGTVVSTVADNITVRFDTEFEVPPRGQFTYTLHKSPWVSVTGLAYLTYRPGDPKQQTEYHHIIEKEQYED